MLPFISYLGHVICHSNKKQLIQVLRILSPQGIAGLGGKSENVLEQAPGSFKDQTYKDFKYRKICVERLGFIISTTLL